MKDNDHDHHISIQSSNEMNNKYSILLFSNLYSPPLPPLFPHFHLPSKSAAGFPNWMNGADPLVSITVSAALGIVVVGMTIAYLINKWRRKDDTRNAAQTGE